MKTWRITFRYQNSTGGVVFHITRTEAEARAWFKEHYPAAEIKVIKPADFSPRRKGVQP